MANAFLLRHLVYFQARHRSGVRSTDVVFVFFWRPAATERDYLVVKLPTQGLV